HGGLGHGVRSRIEVGLVVSGDHGNIQRIKLEGVLSANPRSRMAILRVAFAENRGVARTVGDICHPDVTVSIERASVHLRARDAAMSRDADIVAYAFGYAGASAGVGAEAVESAERIHPAHP